MYNAVPMQHGVSCIIAAHNEDSRIGAVLDAAQKCAQISEIIVVNDGSTDNTRKVLEKYPRCRIFNLPVNQGKASAVSYGVAQAKFDLLLFLDADLSGLTAQNLTDLIRPVLENNNLVVLSMRKSHMLRFMGVDILTGERALPRKYFEALGDVSQAGYAIEALINKYILKHKIPFKVVDWPNVTSPLKKDKMGLFEGTVAEMKMLAQMHREEPIEALVYQFLRMAYEVNDPWAAHKKV